MTAINDLKNRRTEMNLNAFYPHHGNLGDTCAESSSKAGALLCGGKEVMKQRYKFPPIIKRNSTWREKQGPKTIAQIFAAGLASIILTACVTTGGNRVYWGKDPSDFGNRILAAMHSRASVPVRFDPPAPCGYGMVPIQPEKANFHIITLFLPLLEVAERSVDYRCYLSENTPPDTEIFLYEFEVHTWDIKNNSGESNVKALFTLAVSNSAFASLPITTNQYNLRKYRDHFYEQVIKESRKPLIGTSELQKNAYLNYQLGNNQDMQNDSQMLRTIRPKRWSNLAPNQRNKTTEGAQWVIYRTDSYSWMGQGGFQCLELDILIGPPRIYEKEGKNLGISGWRGMQELISPLDFLYAQAWGYYCLHRKEVEEKANKKLLVSSILNSITIHSSALMDGDKRRPLSLVGWGKPAASY